MESSFQFRKINSTDTAWITRMATKLWGSIEIISKEHTYNILNLPNLVGVLHGKPLGFIMYAIEGNECEIVALYSDIKQRGLGTAFIDFVKKEAKKDGCHKVWLLTTNDNTQALRFYQKRGFIITSIRTNVIEAQRKIKPIPLFGNDGIPIRDEIELAMFLEKYPHPDSNRRSTP
jgi:ribosomal protein S18 acetylase RimI-like enzyme